MLLRFFAKVDENNKIFIPPKVINNLKLRAGELVELKIQGINQAPYLVLRKRKIVR
ncbi:MAG: hypothetical protein HYU63_08600 [Armatimonadetes bacterium]|nr:hypothetical protein [Armatimonadota bacterium]